MPTKGASLQAGCKHEVEGVRGLTLTCLATFVFHFFFPCLTKFLSSLQSTGKLWLQRGAGLGQKQV